LKDVDWLKLESFQESEDAAAESKRSESSMRKKRLGDTSTNE